MVLIISKQSLESSTEDVIDWLSCYNVPFRRINGEEVYAKNGISFHIGNDKNEVAGFDEHPYKVVWYRRWRDYADFQFADTTPKDFKMLQELNRNIRGEESAIKFYFFKKLRTRKWLTDYGQDKVNKLYVLDRALEAGLNIPETIVCSSKEDLLHFIARYGTVIVKPVNVGLAASDGDFWYCNYTEEVTVELLEKMPEHFLPTLFQKKIEKLYEVRAFFLGETFYSMAIFSQRDHQTKVDFRKYNDVRPNRKVPFKLPEGIVQKLRHLVSALGLETGSIDLMVDENNDFCFLEVNPVGQFGMTSYPCNYNLEKKIAEFLIKKAND